MREGFVPTLDALAQVFFTDRYQDADGNTWRIKLSLIDAMGHRTAEVYEWCRRHRGQVMPLQGRDNRQQVPVRYTKIKTYPGTRRWILGKLFWAQLNVAYFKSKLSQKLEIVPADPGVWHFQARRPATGPSNTQLNAGT